MLLARQRFVMLVSREKAVADLERLAQAVAEGSVAPPVHAVYPLAHVREAMTELAAGRVVGKTAIAVSGAA
jgi:NADPH:quinone reductase-like Zn-dependent oxidoreductase